MSKSSAGGGCLIVIGAIALFLVLWGVIAAISAVILMFAWNLVFPSLFGWPELTFGMAFGLSLFIGFVGSAFGRLRSN